MKYERLIWIGIALSLLCGIVLTENLVQASEPSTARLRVRDLGIAVGIHPPGPNNAITDVPGVKVGHTTLISGEGVLKPGAGWSVRTEWHWRNDRPSLDH